MSVPPCSTAKILKSNATFTNKVYQILSRTPGNVFFSPLSIHIVLSMAYQGARNETAAIIKDVLQIPDSESTAVCYKWIINNFYTLKQVTLYLANKIYVGKNNQCLTQFENSLKDLFDSEVETLDFEQKSEAVRKINEWVATKTERKIKDIVDEKLLERDSALFLINVVYFKAEWNEIFKGDTVTQEFYLNEKDVINVEMLKGWKNGCYKFDEYLSAQMFGLPYIEKSVKLFFVLPKDRNGIKNLEEKLSTYDFIELFENLEPAKVELSLPKFKMETTMDFSKIIKKVGLELIFDKNKADFRGMFTEQCNNLCVDKILQKAFIEVNEEGSEAGAVTVMRIKRKYCAWTSEEITFVVDHPAIFMVVEGEGEMTKILFCGRLSHPKY